MDKANLIADTMLCPPIWVFNYYVSAMRQTSIYSDIWRDPIFADLSNNAKLLAIYCLTNPNKKLINCYRLPDREIMFDLNIKINELNKTKEELKKINIYFDQNYCFIKNEYCYSNYKGKLLESAMNKELLQLPQNIIELSKSDTISIQYQYPIDRVNSNSNNNSNNNSKLNFDNFWEL